MFEMFGFAHNVNVDDFSLFQWQQINKATDINCIKIIAPTI